MDRLYLLPLLKRRDTPLKISNNKYNCDSSNQEVINSRASIFRGKVSHILEYKLLIGQASPFFDINSSDWQEQLNFYKSNNGEILSSLSCIVNQQWQMPKPNEESKTPVQLSKFPHIKIKDLNNNYNRQVIELFRHMHNPNKTIDIFLSLIEDPIYHKFKNAHSRK